MKQIQTEVQESLAIVFEKLLVSEITITYFSLISIIACALEYEIQSFDSMELGKVQVDSIRVYLLSLGHLASALLVIALYWKYNLTL